MARRSYEQFCSVAEALDILGERWTLLVIRDLLPGPLRYSDLSRKQPEMSSDLLTARLRHLESENVVRRRRLDPPAAATVYELTAPETMRSIVAALAGFGMARLDDPVSTEKRMDAAWGLASIARSIGSDCAEGTVAVVTETGRARLSERDGIATVQYFSPAEVDVTIEGTSRDVLGVLTGHLPRSTPDVTVSGDLSVLDGWLQAIARSAPPSIVAIGPLPVRDC